MTQTKEMNKTVIQFPLFASETVYGMITSLVMRINVRLLVFLNLLPFTASF